MRPIANPIHKFQTVEVERILGEMILDEKEAAADPSGFSENLADLFYMVEHVYEHAYIEGCISKRNMTAVKRTTRYSAIRALSDLNALDLGGRNSELNQISYDAISTADIEKRRIPRDSCRKEFGQNANPAPMHQGLMRSTDPREEPRIIVRRNHYPYFA